MKDDEDEEDESSSEDEGYGDEDDQKEAPKEAPKVEETKEGKCISNWYWAQGVRFKSLN
jgi:hypothetical protein